MFEELSYLGYTLLFTVPFLLFFWLRKEFFDILKKSRKAIILSTLLLTLYGSVIWTVALQWGAWSYNPDKITRFKILGVFIEDITWWFLIGLLFSSFISIAAHYEEKRVDVVNQEIKKLRGSFGNAFAGFRAITLERNSTIHVSLAALALLGGALFRITKEEWLFVILAIGMALAAELFNAVIERLASKVTSDYDEQIRLIKDASAAGVLIASTAAAIVGLAIFLPRILAGIF